ncbi:Conserved_hypothetical protein [Hexamita inflata]|uniref:Uncharacterized protein n=1 Tax=Hexamita inflata TaxID=28002 RepID=A0AA86QT58_9EUKA|nr:Conserved hypothetical protein [Hexamita inflata]
MNYKSARIMYTYLSYFLLNVINIQFQVLNSMLSQNVKSFNVIYRCLKAFLIGKIIFTVKRETASQRIQRIRSQLILFEVCDYLMFPLTQPFSRFQTAIVEASIMYTTCVFSIQTCQNMLEFVGLSIFYMLLVTYIMWYQSNSFAFASVGFSLVFILMLYYYQESDQKSPITEEVQLKKNSQQLEKVFQKHYSQYIQDVNQEQNRHITTIIASIRINFNPEIERLVQFTRLLEQLCLEYKVSFVTVSSKTFQFFVSEEVSTIQKKFDQALQLCSGAQVIAKCLDMKVSAGVAFGEIEQVKQIFGNLQYKQYYGDALELADFVSQHSFDEILVDATGLYDDSRKPGAGFTDPRYGQHFQEPHFAYKTELRKLDFEGETRLIAVAEPRDTMTKQLSDVLIKSGNINDISLNIVIAPSSEPTTDNVTESDSNTATKFIDTRVKYESSQPIIKNSDSPYTEPIHVICPHVQSTANQLEKRSRFAFLKEIQQVMSYQQICSIDQLNIHFSNSLIQNIQPLIPYYFAFGIACALQYQFKVLFSEEMLAQIEIYDRVTLKQWLLRQFVIFAVVGFAELLCVAPYLLFHFGATIDNVKMKTMKAVDIQIQKLLFAIMALWNLTILYGYQTMLKILKNYPHLKSVCDVAQTSAWTITLYVMHNFNQVINVSSQHPLYIYRNLKVFTVMELVHWLVVFRQFPVMAALMLFMQVQQLPVQIYKYYVAVKNIFLQNGIRVNARKQVQILSRHRMQLQVNSELLLLTKNQPILQQDIVGDLMVKYEKLKTEPVTESDDETIFMTYLNAKLKLQLPEVPVVHLNNCVLFQLEYGFESVEKTNAVLAEVFQSFGAQHHLLLLRASRKATSWVCYRESGTKADLFPHVQFVLLCLFQLLQKHEHVGVKLAVGDVRGVTLCYEDVHCDVVGEAAAELQDFHSSAGKVKVSKKFWEWYRQHEAGSAGNQAIKFQKRFIDHGVQVELCK